MLLCTRLNFQGDSGKWWFCVLHLVHFSRILILWQALSLKKQIRGWNWKGYHRVFFCAMTDTSGKVKDVSVICCRLHWEWSCLWTFSHRERLTRTDLTEWLASCLPLLYLSAFSFFFLKYIFYAFLFSVFLVVVVDVCDNFYEESWRWLPVGNYQRSGALCLMNVLKK